MAVSARTEPRFTRDVDVAVAIADDEDAESVIEPEVAQEAESIAVLPGIEVPVARTGHLLALKVLSRSPERPQDSADIIALMRVVDAVERARAVDAARLIVARGFARGKSLEAEVAALVGTSAKS